MYSSVLFIDQLSKWNYCISYTEKRIRKD